MILPMLALITAMLFVFVFRRDANSGQGVARRVLLPVLAVAIVGMFATGGIAVGNNPDGSSSPLPYVVLGGVMLLAVGLLVLPRPREVTEQRWTARTATLPSEHTAETAVARSTPSSSSTSTAFVVVADRSIVEPRVSHPPSTTSEVARSLARVESRELAQSPLFGIGIGFCVLTLVLFVGVWGDDDSSSWAEWIQYLPWFAHPLVGMTVFASHRAVTRAGRDDTVELFDTCPAEQSTRTVGFLLTAVVPMAAIAVYIAVLLAGINWFNPSVHGPLELANLGDVAGTILLGGGGVVLGVALGRWLRLGLVPVVAIVAVAMASTSLNGVGGGDWNPLRELSTLPTVEGPSPVFAYRPIGWHLLWLVALTGLVVAIALARHRRDRFVAVLAVGSIVVGAVAGIAVTRPMPASAAREIASLIAEPEAHQRCIDVEGRVTVCTYSLHREFLDSAGERFAPIVAVLPDAAAPVTFRQVYDSQLADLAPEVRRLLTPFDLVRPEGEVPFVFKLERPPLDHGLELALAVVGLPTRAGAALMPYVAAGEARGVVALWFASRGLDEQKAAQLSRPGTDEPVGSFERGSVYPAGGSCDVPSVTFSAQDLTAVRAVQALPEADVARVLEADWDRWIDPSTTTDEFLAALGLPGVGAPDLIVPQPGDPC